MNEKITFANLVDKIAEETGASKRLIHDLLTETVDLIKEGLNREGHVNLRDLGRFRLKWHEVRSGRNPQTGEPIEIPAHSSVNFKAEADLREFINRQYSHLKPEILKGEVERTEAEPTDVSINEKEKKRSAKWPWLLIPLVIIILAYLFWPSKKVTETDVKEPLLTEGAEQPEQKPVVEDIEVGTPGGQHTVQPGEKLWTISQDFYKQAYLWPNIYRVNLNKIVNPDLLLIGTEVQIPSLQGKSGNLTQKDIEQIAEGFVEVYLIYKQLGKGKALDYLWVVQKCNVNEVVDRYKDRIDVTDLELVGKIEGSHRIK